MMGNHSNYYTGKYILHQDVDSDWDSVPYWIAVKRQIDGTNVLTSNWDNPIFYGTEEEYQELVQILANHDEVTGEK
jgi:maltose-binding protein MalE